jgi:hypothetical protein
MPKRHFGEIGPLEQTYTPVFCVDVRRNTRRTLLFCSTDVRLGTTGRTLIDSTSYSMNSIWMYAQKYQTCTTF